MTISAISNKNYLTSPLSEKIHLLPSALSTYQKIMKYALYFFTFGLAYVLYETAKILQKSSYSLFPGREIKTNIEAIECTDYRKQSENIKKYNTLGLSTLNFIGSQTRNSRITYGVSKETFKQTKRKGESLIFPVITKGLFRDHITFLGINFKTKQIVFFDPKGNTLKDLKNRKISYPSTCDTIGETWSRIYQTLSDVEGDDIDKWKLLQNNREIQRDSYNCGVHFYNACRIFESNPENPEKIFEDTCILDSREKISSKREEIIDALKSEKW